ncbi:MAG: FmdE family protein [Candidatus Hydrothermarchaeales archaeon]
MTDLEDGVRFHGHLCPMFYLGVRMGELALKKLNRERENGVKLHAVVEFANCFGDGIQYVTGATFGKNNLHLEDRGKFASSFYDLGSGMSLRLRMKENVAKNVLKYGKAGRKVKKLPAAKREEEARRLMVTGKEMVEWLKGLADEELFETTPAPPFTPKEGPSLDYVTCQKCGELTLKEYTKKKGSTPLCRSCYPL